MPSDFTRTKPGTRTLLPAHYRGLPTVLGSSTRKLSRLLFSSKYATATGDVSKHETSQRYTSRVKCGVDRGRGFSLILWSAGVGIPCVIGRMLVVPSRPLAASFSLLCTRAQSNAYLHLS